MDEARVVNGARVCSLAPGVIDTDMQVQLRGADVSQFPDQAMFADLHTKGQLSSADDAAAHILAYLARPDFGSEPVADVRDQKNSTSKVTSALDGTSILAGRMSEGNQSAISVRQTSIANGSSVVRMGTMM